MEEKDPTSKVMIYSVAALLFAIVAAAVGLYFFFFNPEMLWFLIGAH